MPKTIRITPIFAWYDCWVGLFWDRTKRRLYVFPLPTLGFVIEIEEAPRG